MEKYAKLMKGLEVCAGPDCCKDGCPYYGKTTGDMTCRARLLADASSAINNERALRESAEKKMRNAVETLGIAETVNNNLRNERDERSKECKELKEYALALEKEGQEARAKGDKLREELAKVNDQYRQMTTELSRLHADVDDLEAVNHTLRAERNGLRIEVEMMRQEKTDRRSVGFDGSTAYWCGRADALAEVVGHMFEGEAPCK